MTTRSRPHRMSGFYALFFLGNVLGVPLNLLLGNYAGAAANGLVAAFMWWVHRR